ncbi:cytochrome b5-like heme/steroid binding domain-containing protein [Astrocystis sublimbata]|nr:cytochrome b5-like heme/steroid binding domain-containing protein [Astrocystis sublimbata]
MTSTNQQRSEGIDFQQLANHNTVESLWIAVHGYVYDLTNFRFDHPGGVDALLSSAGTDGTEAFEYAAHSKENMATMQKFRIGTLSGSRAETTPDSHAHSVSQIKRAKRAEPVGKPWWTTLAAALIAATVFVAVSCRYLSFSLSDLEIRLPNLGGQNTVHAFWAGMGASSLVSMLVFRYIYLLFLSSLDFQSNVFSYPPTIPRKQRRHGH